MVLFIDNHRADYTLEPICSQLPIAPPTFYAHKTREADPKRLPPQAERDAALYPQIQWVWDENFQMYGFRKVWRQLNRKDIRVGHCTTGRLMNLFSLEGVRRGRRCRTTIPDTAADRLADLVQRQFIADRPQL